MNMDQSLLVNATGRALYSVGGSTSFAQHEFKGYVVSLEWDEKDGEPCMLMWAASGGRDAGVFGICLSSAGKYADPSGRPTDECFMACAEVLPTLGRDISRGELMTLVDVVLQFIPDLLRMPPAPRAARQKYLGAPVMEVATQDQAGRIVHQAEL